MFNIDELDIQELITIYLLDNTGEKLDRKDIDYWYIFDEELKDLTNKLEEKIKEKYRKL